VGRVAVEWDHLAADVSIKETLEINRQRCLPPSRLQQFDPGSDFQHRDRGYPGVPVRLAVEPCNTIRVRCESLR
jgi:hypothetical protein